MAEWQGRYEALEKELAPLDLPNAVEAAAMAEAREMMEDVEEEDEEASEKEEGGEEEIVKKEPGEEDDEEEELKTPKKARAKPKPKVSKAKPRKSDGIDLAAADQSHLLASVDQDTLTRLRLTKKYYADAISFIEQLDRAMDTVADLLASTVKSEVLEAMDFFKIAYEYRIDSAEVRPLSPFPVRGRLTSCRSCRRASSGCCTSFGPRTRRRRRRTARRSRGSARDSSSATRSSTLSPSPTFRPKSRSAASRRM